LSYICDSVSSRVVLHRKIKQESAREKPILIKQLFEHNSVAVLPDIGTFTMGTASVGKAQ
jgi:hypothetical protein